MDRADMSEAVAPSPLISVSDALVRILAAAQGRAIVEEDISIWDGDGRVLSAALHALHNQPAMTMSAMDGFALRAGETVPGGMPLRVIGESAAGHPFKGQLGPGEAIRIFTGAALPDGADAVLIQENASLDNGLLSANGAVLPGQFVRRMGDDFRRGDLGLPAGERLDPRKLAFAAAMNHATVRVSRRPRVGLLTTGDELVRPGPLAGPMQTIASNAIGIASELRRAGADIIDLGIAADTRKSILNAVNQALALPVDLLVTIGGASVGKHDLVRPVLAERGADLEFYRVAMRPGKPLNFGSLEGVLVLGLPGNPVSAMVCARLFGTSLLRALQGDRQAGSDESELARLGKDLPANDLRQDYLRASLAQNDRGELVATPFDSQDSALSGVLARAQALLIRPPYASAAKAGTVCSIIRI
ncbi:MoeA Molybdopterin biosynthesis enzyme [Rhabdaerophilaceae bacterium]